MGKFKGCLLASDVDETLISEGLIPLKNIKKIDEFVKNGGTFSLCSGRSIEALRQVTRQIENNIIGPSPVFNGAVIYDFSKDKVLYEENINPREKEFTKYVIENMPEIGIEVHTRDVCYVVNRNVYTDIHEDYEGINAEFCSYEDIKNLSWVKVLFIPFSDEKRKKLRCLAESFTDGSSVFYDSAATITGIQNLYLEQMRFGVSKGAALHRLRSILSIADGKLWGIGDYYNDVSMLKEVDIAALTLGSPDDLKQMAEYITCSCAEGAVADFIDYLKQKL